MLRLSTRSRFTAEPCRVCARAQSRPTPRRDSPTRRRGAGKARAQESEALPTSFKATRGSCCPGTRGQRGRLQNTQNGGCRSPRHPRGTTTSPHRARGHASRPFARGEGRVQGTDCDGMKSIHSKASERLQFFLTPRKPFRKKKQEQTTAWSKHFGHSMG